jgi:DNA invertase Pin-like site-specific DNA recombinase
MMAALYARVSTHAGQDPLIAAARARGRRLGRPRRDVDVSRVATLRAEGLSWREVGRELGVGVATARAAFQNRAKNLSETALVSD